MSGFADVDATAEPDRYASYLREVSAVDAVAAAKGDALTALRLRPGARVIDVGCGLGEDAWELARIVGPRGHVVGVDSSRAMLERARRPARPDEAPVEFVLGDAQRLPFDPGTFDAARVERTLQHLADPEAAVRELARVTRGGGVVTAIEPDWGTLAIAGGPVRLVQAMCAEVETRIRNAWIGRELAGLFLANDLRDVSVGVRALVMREFAAMRMFVDVALLVAALRERGYDDVDDLLERLEADSRAGRAVVALTLFTVTGRVA
jgi:ubiquinone/menaquinone biosynthesis C-methylase UbiE